MSLRSLTESDLAMVLSWRNAPEVRKNMYSTHEITEAEHLAWFVRTQQDTTSRWYIHLSPSGLEDGVVYFTQCDGKHGNAFWGFYTAPNAALGTGTRLGLDALDEAFDTLNLHKLNAEVLSANERSVEFHLKLGFTQEGLFRDFHFDNGRYIDVVRLGILSTEWQLRKIEVKNRIAMFESARQVR